jgi:hypothetical protein
MLAEDLGLGGFRAGELQRFHTRFGGERVDVGRRYEGVATLTALEDVLWTRARESGWDVTDRFLTDGDFIIRGRREADGTVVLLRVIGVLRQTAAVVDVLLSTQVR